LNDPPNGFEWEIARGQRSRQNQKHP